MASHESFWVAVAAAAPIIALANTVTITDPVSVYFEKRKQSKVKTAYTLSVIVVASAITLVGETIILAGALFSLLQDRDDISPVLAIGGLTIGLTYILVNVLAAIQVRRMYSEEVETEEIS